MTNGWCSSEGHMAKLGFDTTMCRDTVDKCRSLIMYAHQSNVQVIFTQHIYREDYSDGGFIVDEIMPELKSVKPASANAWSNQIVTQLRPLQQDIVIKKNRYSAFFLRISQTILSDSPSLTWYYAVSQPVCVSKVQHGTQLKEITELSWLKMQQPISKLFDTNKH